MSKLFGIHKSAGADHYNGAAANYDLFNESNSATINRTVCKLLDKYCARNILDLTCETGSQVFWLHRHGFEVVGYDINSAMLSVAREGAQDAGLSLQFHSGDMRSVRARRYDAVITIFNSIGHLTREDFGTVTKNVGANLQDRGLYVFDIFNLDCLLHKDNITKLTVDSVRRAESGQELREIQCSTIDRDGILASYNVCVHQHRVVSSQTLQVYTRAQLTDMLSDCGFGVLCCCGIDGGEFCKTGTERMLIVAQKHAD